MGIKTVILSHPTGNINVREVAEALEKAGSLGKFYTSVAVFKNTFPHIISKYGPLKEFRRRSFASNLKPFTCTRPYLELARMASQKLGYHNALKHEKGIFCVDKVYNDLDSHVSKKLRNNSAVYAYEDGAFESFKRARSKGIFCLYDLPTGYWRAHSKFLEKERIERPEWAMTLTSFKDSELKLKRKDKELSMADAIFVASNFTKRTLELFPGQLAPIHLVPYGFPEVYKNRKYENIANRKLKLLFVGGLSQLKGIANLFEAVNHLGDRVKLTIVGRKVVQGCIPLEKELKKHNWIQSLPHDQILSLMRSQDVFVFPSLFEGYGLVIAEAMSQGTPVITTTRTCGNDFIKNGENGWLIEPGDTKELVKKLEHILSHPEILPQVGKAASATAGESPFSIYGNKMVKIINEIIK
jgi:glycosyltransferase involved in cell wall biosynthesis